MSSCRAARCAAASRLHPLLLLCTLGVWPILPACTVYEAYRNCGLQGCPGDAAVAAEVRDLLAQHPALEPPNMVTVQSIDHVVYLYGLVDTDLQKQLAESVAQQARGAKRVVDSIGLRNGTF